MTESQYDEGIAILGSFGAPIHEVDPQTLQLWMEALIDLNFEDYRKAIIEICKTKTTFFPNDNIPALIREKSIEFRNKRALANQKFFDEVEQWKRQREIEGPPEIKQLVQQIVGD